MLNENEWQSVDALWKQGFAVKGVPMDERFEAMKQEYTRLTGFVESNQLAIMHHRESLYGQPCKTCGKPLRTPEAALCAACGSKPSD